jgi:hypothetical protein
MLYCCTILKIKLTVSQQDGNLIASYESLLPHEDEHVTVQIVYINGNHFDVIKKFDAPGLLTHNFINNTTPSTSGATATSAITLDATTGGVEASASQ